jgi:outer membrane protein
MRSTTRATVIALALSVVASVAGGQPPRTKIGYINSQALLDAAPGKATADSALNKMGQGFQAQLAKLQDSAQKLLTDYQKNEPKLTQAMKDKAQKDLNTIETALQTKSQELQQQFNTRRDELMAPITDAIRKVIEDIAVENGYAIVFDNAPGQSNIVNADKNLDITDKVVSRLRATPAPKLNADTKEPAKGAPAAPAGVTKPPTRPPTI